MLAEADLTLGQRHTEPTGEWKHSTDEMGLFQYPEVVIECRGICTDIRSSP